MSKVVLVTGASSGLGRACAEALAAAGSLAGPRPPATTRCEASAGWMEKDERRGLEPARFARQVLSLVEHPQPTFRHLAIAPVERLALWLRAAALPLVRAAVLAFLPRQLSRAPPLELLLPLR